MFSGELAISFILAIWPSLHISKWKLVKLPIFELGTANVSKIVKVNDDEYFLWIHGSTVLGAISQFV